MHSPSRGDTYGFSLIELMVTVAIVAILAGIAYPTYQNQVASGRRSDAQAELMQLAQFMERLYTETGCYNPGSDNDCSAGTAAAPSISIGSDYYTVRFAGTTTANTYRIVATPTGPQAGNGVMDINERGQRRWDENNNGTFETHENDWVRN